MSKELKPCPLLCNLEQLNERILNLGVRIAQMGEQNTIRVHKEFLVAVLGYMEELLGMRREEEHRRVAPENKPLTLGQLRQMDDYPQPIWIELLNIAKPISCELITSISEDGIHTMAESGRDYAAFSLYGKTWLAYARKPEGDKP